jgi:WD40 repeat protein
VYLWDFIKRKEIAVLLGHKSHVRSVALSLDEKYLISNGYREVITWNIQARNIIARKNFRKDSFANAAFHPEGELVATVLNKELVLLDPLTFSVVHSLTKDQKESIKWLSFSPDGKSLFVGSWHDFSIYDFSSKKLTKNIQLDLRKEFIKREIFSGSIEEAYFNLKGDTIFIISKGGSLIIYSITEDRIINTFFRLPVLSGADFRYANGISEELNKQLIINGAIT